MTRSPAASATGRRRVRCGAARARSPRCAPRPAAPRRPPAPPAGAGPRHRSARRRPAPAPRPSGPARRWCGPSPPRSRRGERPPTTREPLPAKTIGWRARRTPHRAEARRAGRRPPVPPDPRRTTRRRRRPRAGSRGDVGSSSIGAASAAVSTPRASAECAGTPIRLPRGNGDTRPRDQTPAEVVRGVTRSSPRPTSRASSRASGRRASIASAPASTVSPPTSTSASLPPTLPLDSSTTTCTSGRVDTIAQAAARPEIPAPTTTTVGELMSGTDPGSQTLAAAVGASEASRGESRPSRDRVEIGAGNRSLRSRRRSADIPCHHRAKAARHVPPAPGQRTDLPAAPVAAPAPASDPAPRPASWSRPARCVTAVALGAAGCGSGHGGASSSGGSAASVGSGGRPSAAAPLPSRPRAPRSSPAAARPRSTSRPARRPPLTCCSSGG